MCDYFLGDFNLKFLSCEEKVFLNFLFLGDINIYYVNIFCSGILWYYCFSKVCKLCREFY